MRLTHGGSGKNIRVFHAPDSKQTIHFVCAIRSVMWLGVRRFRNPVTCHCVREGWKSLVRRLGSTRTRRAAVVASASQREMLGP